MSARKTANQRWTSQPALACDGMATATLGSVEATEDNLGDILSLWAERIAECHEAVRQISL